MKNKMNYMKAAVGHVKADLVLKGGYIVNVFTQSIHRDDVAIVDGFIAGIGKYQGENEINCEGMYITPGFIDAHVHIESSKVIPEIFSGLLIKRGVMTCIADPHEIANVLGEDGIEFMIENSRKSLIDIYFMMPSCVPSVEFEDNGAELSADSLGRFIKNTNVLGLGEVMDVPSVINGRKEMKRKLLLFKDMVIDGHCPEINREWLNGYIFAGVRTDHECFTSIQAAEEIKRGMYVMLREGSADKNVKNLLSAVNEGNFHRFLFCTDDKDITDLDREGSIDQNIRVAVENGMDPVKAITIATLNAAECYGLKHKGAIAPGYAADIVVLDNLEKVSIRHVIRKGREYSKYEYNNPEVNIRSSMNINHVSEDMFKIRQESDRVNVIKVIKNSIKTYKVEREVLVSNGFVNGIKSDDSMKIAVFERHKITGKYGLGFIEGLGLKQCSVAQTISHDSHNIIVVGDNDRDMESGVNRVIDIKGGIVIVSGGSVIEEISLPAAGLMTFEDPKIVIEKLKKMNNIIKKFEDGSGIDAFLTLSFMSLPVIPEIKITARGLYDFNEGRFINLFVD